MIAILRAFRSSTDWIIDLGPGGGGAIVAAGSPEDVVKEKRGYTGQHLKPVLAKGGPKRRKVEAAE